MSLNAIWKDCDIKIRVPDLEKIRKKDLRRILSSKLVEKPDGTGGALFVWQDGGVAGFPPPKTIGSPKLGRNDPCYCGSGIKFKKCHGKPS